MKISFITTVFNEDKTIIQFLKSLADQTRMPDEIIIVDGGSTDATASMIADFNFESSNNKKNKIKLVIKKGNRSVGRNEAIRQSHGDIIVCSDSGNELDKNWLKNITQPFLNKKVDVVAGYYKGKASTVFQKCVIPFALVMPDKVNPNKFLPATRSIAFTKSIWKKARGFDKNFSHNEDYVFAKKLKSINANIVFEKKAIVNWLPRSNYKAAFIMFFRFAFGDAEAKILRPKVLLLFARYLLGLYFIFLCLLYKSVIGLALFGIAFILYILWSINKNYRYVKDRRAFYILPLLQFTADFAVLSGTVMGFFKKVRSYSYITFIKNNKLLFTVLLFYIAILLSTLRWGVPNQNHPFPYHMDEWHQLQAVGNTFRYGTPNTEGSANGTMFHFLLSGLYLVPFTLLQLVNPFSLEIENSFMRERIFEILRIQTMLFGVFSIFLIYKIAELIGASKKLVIILFTFTPIWLSLSGYFKYDIALLFWILASLYFIMKFARESTNRNLILAAIPVSLAVAVKISAIPLLLIYIFSYFLFSREWYKNLKYLFLGVSVFTICLLLTGMTDTLFGKGNILDYLYQNIISTPNSSSEDYSGLRGYIYLFGLHIPLIFGHGLSILFLIALVVSVISLFKSRIHTFNSKIQIFLIVSLSLFTISLLPLKITAAGNRMLVLLPFLVLIVGLVWSKYYVLKKISSVMIGFVILAIGIQFYESYAFLHIKTAVSPQSVASLWIKSNLSKNASIGIENIPIYQQVPDIVQKEFYFSEYNIKQESQYSYEVISSTSPNLPEIVIITNEYLEPKILKKSDKKNLVQRLQREGYKKREVFYPDIQYYQIVGNDVDYYYSGLIAVPWSTSIYEKK